MPRFFDVQDAGQQVRDAQGTELPDACEIWEIAVLTVDDVVRQKGHMHPPHSIAVSVRDASNVVVYGTHRANPSNSDEATTKFCSSSS